MNIPNMLTLSRFFLIPLYLFVFFEGYIKTAFIIMVLAGLTDILDGYLARKKGQVTPLGAMLDPLADKTMMIAVIVSLLISQMIPWQAAIAMFIRDIGMIAGSAFFHFRGKKTVPANIMGKLTTVLYYLAVLLIVFKIPFAVQYLWFVVIVSFLTSIIYIVQFSLLNQNENKANS